MTNAQDRDWGIEPTTQATPQDSETQAAVSSDEQTAVTEEPSESTDSTVEVPAAVAEEASATPETYTVQSGDSLSAIALRLYGDASAYVRIFEANRDKISNPNLIFPGQVLMIPR